MNREEWVEWKKTTNRTEFIGGVPFTPGEAAHLRKHIGEQIAKEMEILYHDDRENTCRKDNCIPCMIVDSAILITRGNRD